MSPRAKSTRDFDELERRRMRAARLLHRGVRPADAQIDAPLARERAEGIDQERVAESVRYIPTYDIYVVALSNGERLVLQREKLQGLHQATKAQLANVEVGMLGTALSWPALDVDLYVPALMKGIFGTKKWMSELGRAGGSVKSKAKAQAARENGAKGGRPKVLKGRRLG
jgi:hypothetical protein